MTDTQRSPLFTLGAIYQAASELLELRPDAIIAYRLLREVLRVPGNDPQLIEAKNAAMTSKWVDQLKASQLPDGSWGRFHSQDTRKKTVFRTTEEAIDRAFSLGLEPAERSLAHVCQYIQQVLLGNAKITDRDEKHESWSLGIKFILAGRLAQIDPGNKLLSLFWIYLTEVADQAFSSGNYRLEDEVSAYLRLSGINWQEGFLESQHTLWILSSRRLPEQLERAMVNWIWHKPDGIRYLRASLAEPQPHQIGYWLRSMNIISRFRAWREICVGTLNELWAQRDANSGWDFGSQISRIVDFPISESWRQPGNRRIDYSTCILVLLRKYFDET